METLFIQILNMSMSASWLIIVVIFIRLLLQKVPKGFRYVLWALVAVRLLCPVYFESELSLLPDQGILSEVGDAVKPVTPIIPNEDSGLNDTIMNDDIQNNTTPNDVQQNDVLQNDAGPKTGLDAVLACFWVAGMLVLFVYAVISYVKLRDIIKDSVKREDNLWVCDVIQTPFILGMIRPRIYLPSYIEEGHVPYIVAHENEHIRLKDHWWKMLGFALLTVHWFNPLVWVAYILLCRDIEMACDERVIRTMGVEDKKNYSKSLLFCSIPRNFISACPVAFGEVGVKIRIKKIVDYKKPSAWIITIASVICLIMVLGFMTNPKQKAKDVARIELGRSSIGIVWVDITDADTVQQIMNEINDLSFVPISPNLPSGGWSYEIRMYDVEGNMIDRMTILGDRQVENEFFVYYSITGKFDTQYFDEVIAKAEFERLENLQSDESVSSDDQSVNLISHQLLYWFYTEYFNNSKKDYMFIGNQFLTSEYTSPKDIDLYELFYNGAYIVGNESVVSEEEKQLLLDRYFDKIHSPVIRITTREMNEFLQKYMGITLEETNKYGLDKMYYLEEYDAYYFMHSDTNVRYAIFQAGKINDDGTITLMYTPHTMDGGSIYWVTLKEEEGKYYIISNVMVESESR